LDYIINGRHYNNLWCFSSISLSANLLICLAQCQWPDWGCDIYIYAPESHLANNYKFPALLVYLDACRLYPRAIIRGSSSAKPKINAISSKFRNAAHAQDDKPRPGPQGCAGFCPCQLDLTWLSSSDGIGTIFLALGTFYKMSVYIGTCLLVIKRGR